MPRILCVLLLLAVASAAHAQEEPLAKKVKSSITKGVEFLVNQQLANGSWPEIVDDDKAKFDGGATALTVLALLNCDGVLDNPALEKKRRQAIARGLANLRNIDSPKVYVRSLQAMAFAEAKMMGLGDAKTDIPKIQENVRWLLGARVYRDGKFIGWDYHSRAEARASDASNSQFAMLGLWYARQAGVPIDRKVWEEIRDYYVRTQLANGAWVYSPYYDEKDLNSPSLTMTVAGLCGLLISGQELNAGREKWQNGKADNCGAYDENLGVAKAQVWLRNSFKIDLVTGRSRIYYHLYGLERAGRLSGNRFFGEHDWYREGCEFIVRKQDAAGAWLSRDGFDRWPHVNTSFALLFLSKGRTPVVVSKLVHGTSFPNRDLDNDWNNDRNDLRHLTDYITTTDLFEKKAIAWQTYDIRRAVESSRDKFNLGPEEEAAILSDMRQSPILYITGHRSFNGRLSDLETRLIKRYIETGGFIIAEACCGDPAFDKGFKQWVKDTWEDDLKYIDSEHPVWTCYNKLTPGEASKLMELKAGCRTVMLYSSQDLSCRWESNQHDGAARPAFQLGANMIAYATGRVPPQPRLTQIQVASVEKGPKEPSKRGEFVVYQVRHSPDWQPAPKAMTRLLDNVQRVTNLEVRPRASQLFFTDGKEVRGAKFLYMHGRGDFRVQTDLEPLRFTLEYGGLLFADACCGDKAFDKAFRKFVQELFPKEKLVRVPAELMNRDRLFGKVYNGGEELTTSNIRCRVKSGAKVEPMEPYLEGIQLNGRWVVLYSPYDIGCALEGSTSSDCVGYDTDSAMRIATAIVRYNTQP